MKFENVTDKHHVLKAACIGIERNLDLAKDGDEGGLVEVVISLRQCGEYIAQQYLLHFGEKGRNDSLSEMLKRLEPLFQKDQKDEYGREFLKTLHRIKTEANSVIHSPEGRHVEVTMLTGLAENLDALLPQFYKDIPDKLKEQTEENMQ